eukprot:TRINITY_DN24622_c0_g1_i3.p1 TRINITY_DN24622_c0_g1~~TRINITY_DN24622_c0_g1_i3.p1  ORF type:complete len:872 (+),score=195.66 TRINITY_DN24622_c0_g1_i3:62-2617(+)
MSMLTVPARIPRLRCQRRCISAGGRSSAITAELVDPATGKPEPGWVPQQLARVMMNEGDRFSPDSWEKKPGVAAKPTFPLPAAAVRSTHLHDAGAEPIYIAPYLDGGLQPNAEWDKFHPNEEHVPVGIEFRDPTIAEQYSQEFLRRSTPRSVGLHPAICSTLETLGIRQLSAGQSEAIPAMLEGWDVQMSTYPGSGKTLSAVCHVIHKQLVEHPQAPFSTVYVTPTEGLAHQVVRWLQTIGRMSGVVVPEFCGLAVDSKPVKENMEELLGRRPSVIVGTPGRLGDLVHTFDTPFWDLQRTVLHRLIVDEADVTVPHFDQTALGNTLMHVLARTSKAKDASGTPWGGRPQQKIFLSSTIDYATRRHLSQWCRKGNFKHVNNLRGKFFGTFKGGISGLPHGHNNAVSTERDRRDRRLEDGGTNMKRLWGTIGLPPHLKHTVVSSPRGKGRWEAMAEMAMDVARRQNASGVVDSGGISASETAGMLPPGSSAGLKPPAAGTALAPVSKEVAVADHGPPPAVRDSEGRWRPAPQRVVFRGLVIVESAAAGAEALAALSSAGFKGKVGHVSNPQALRLYAQGSLPVMLATPMDIRGIDLPYLTHVFVTCDIRGAADYIHVAGRVGRCGRSGVVASFVEPKNLRSLRQSLVALLAEHTVAEGKAELPLSVPTLVWGGERRWRQESTFAEDEPIGPPRMVWSMLIDDPFALNMLSDGKGAEPGVPQAFHPDRNDFGPDGKVTPKSDKASWIGGFTHTGLMSDDELDVMAEMNEIKFIERLPEDLRRGGTGAGTPDGVKGPRPDGSLMSPGERERLTRAAVTPPEVRDRIGVMAETDKVMRLARARNRAAAIGNRAAHA